MAGPTPAHNTPAESPAIVDPAGSAAPAAALRSAAAGGLTVEVAAPTPESLRETIESIILAFILAFVFRAFLVEAFRIPTGSMAPTLYGDHGQLRCDECGFPFAFNMREPELKQPFEVACPNCTHRSTVPASPQQPYRAKGGDRILVLKWPYDVGGGWLGPHRWDVSVFKDPKDSQTNFIKRLIGLPGEVLEIIDGDVYAAPAERVPEAIRAKLSPIGTPGLSKDDYRRLNSLLRIQRKTALAQRSLWLPHYDHDYPASRSEPRRAYWDAPEKSGWNTTRPRIAFDGKRDKEAFITLAGRPIEDQYGYNGVQAWVHHMERSIEVPDVRIEFVLVPGAAPDGRVSASISRDDVTFTARWQAGGKAELLVSRPDRPGYEETLLEYSGAPLAAGRPMEIALENCDYRVRCEVDGRCVFETTDKMYAPSLDALRVRDSQIVRGIGQAPRTSVRIGAAGMPLELWHVRVLRDVYYRAATSEYGFQPGYPGSGRGTGGNPVLLRDGEYYMCGDNSPQSKDSRLWVAAEVSSLLQERGDEYQVGTVPMDQMIGRAFFVYWPSGKPLLTPTGPAIVPDAGRMRLIR